MAQELVDPQTDPQATDDAPCPSLVWTIIAGLLSNIERAIRLFELSLTRNTHREWRDEEKRRNPRTCPLCGGPMRPDKRPPRDVRQLDGKIRRLPEEALEWFRCVRCEAAQIGVPARKLVNGGRRRAA